MRRRDVRPPSDWDISNKKPAADFSARALHDFRDDVVLPVICPTCQILFAARQQIAENARKRVRSLKPSLRIVSLRMKSPLPFSGAGFTMSAMMSMCP
jgi:hypothetical protein